jgi:hypothetical protein
MSANAWRRSQLWAAAGNALPQIALTTTLLGCYTNSLSNAISYKNKGLERNSYEGCLKQWTVKNRSFSS